MDFDFTWLENVRSEYGWMEQRLYTLQGPYAPPPPKRKPKIKKAPAKKTAAKKAVARIKGPAK
ncbi:MAG TPA: hypothetical protein VMB79_01020 [Jatrophihabitans sp.]|nr:hypothetical protein [Jatrophihabitans sp.]